MRRHFVTIIGLFFILLAQSLRAASSCPLDSVLTFNIDSLLTEVTIYDYVVDTPRTTVWTVDPTTGIRTGKSREEFYSSNLKTMTASYEWDNSKNDWKGKAKSEYVYKYFAGKKMLISSTTFTWLNAAWAADKRYTYDYDNSARETEYFEYKRNTTTNILEPVNGHVYEWLNDDQKTLEEIYTTYTNGAWSAGTKQEWAFDEAGRQTLSTFYGTITSGNWVGTSKEEWGYTDSVLTMTAQYVWANDDWEGTLKEVWAFDTIGRTTLHEQYGWYNSDWSMTLREIADFDEAGNQTLIENYTGANGVTTGTQKEEYTFDENGNKTLIIVYKWSKGAWVGSTHEITEYNGPKGEKSYYEKQVWRSGAWGDSIQETWVFDGPDGKQTLHERYSWNTTAASMLKTLEYTDEYDSDGHLIRKENYTFTNGVKKGVTYYTYTYVNGKKTAYTVYAWDADLPGWVGDKNEIWEFNGPSNKQTLHEKSVWENDTWTTTLRETIEYTGNYATLKENYELIEGVWTGTLKEEYTYDGSKKIETIAYKWENSAWVNDTKETWNPSSTKPTLHEQFIWNGEWVKTLQENTTYEGNNKILIENYALIEGVWTGTEKEKWTYESGHVTLHEQYAWDTDWIITLQENTTYEGNNKILVENYALIEGVWTGTEKEKWTYESGHITLHEQYAWDGDWIITLQENTVYEGSNKVLIENYARVDGVIVGTEKEAWNYENGQITLHEQFTWEGSWVITLQEKTTYDDANITGIENYIFTDGQWMVQKEDYVYTDGQKTQTIIYALINSVWEYSTKVIEGSRNDNVVISETNYVWGGDAWIGEGTRTETTYDDEDRVTELLTQDWPEGATDWTNSTITQHTFNANGDKILTYNGTWNGSRWTVSSMNRLDKIVDDQGRQLLKATWQCGNDSIWKGIQKDTAKYSTTGKTLYSAQFKGWKNNDWVPSSLVENTYDAEDRPLIEERYEWRSNKKQGVYRYEYAYDEQGHRTAYTVYKGWNTSKDIWKGSSKEEKSYDSYGNLLSHTIYDWSSNQWEPMLQYNYTYDASNREIEQLVLAYSANGWYNYKKYIKEYNGSRLITDEEYVWFNNQWSIRNRNELLYDNDTQAKLRREIVGTWSSKGLTSYNNNYYNYACDARIIRFVNYDGTPLQTDTLYKGAIPNYIGEEPTRTDEGNTYVFIGWTPEIATVTGDATYTATFSSTVNQYTITFKDEDGTILSSQLLDFGATPTCTEPTKAPDAQYTYSFAGWSPAIANVTKDATYTATYNHTLRQYSVTFKDEDGSTLDSRLWDFGATPTCTEPTKEATAQYTYSFAGWSPTVIAVNGEATYTATYTQSTRQYTITFKDEDGSILDSRLWDYNATPTCTEPTKESTAQYTYSFAGWSPAIANVNGDATYIATYSSTTRQYTITFKDEDGTILNNDLWYYDATPSCAEPTKDPDAQYTYTFAGWSPAIANVTGEATYVATYSSTTNQYTITFKDEDGSTLDSRLWDYNATPTCTEPSKDATAEYTYTFAGWSPAVAAVTGNATYTATYSSSKNSYTITWLDAEGTEIDQTTVEFGLTPAHADIEKESTAEYTYLFAGWSPAIVPVTGDATYQATFTASKRSYLITFYYENGTTILDQVMVEYGATPATSLIPSSPSDAHYSYTFAGWAPEVVPVTGEASYVATYTAIPNKYTITFKNYNGRVLERTKVEYGATPVYEGETPFRPATASCVYEFSGWSPEIAEVIGDATYTAIFEAIINTYTIIFYDEDGITELDRTIVEHGQKPTTDVVPTKPEDEEFTYTFAGWNPKVVKATADASYVATYTAKSKTTPEGVSNVDAASEQVTKVIIDGQIFILRGAHIYSIDGVLVR